MSSPPKKRQRTARACTKCRQAKLKCDGAWPTCSTCLQGRKHCSYEAAQKRRGLRSGYVRAMEALLGIVLEQVEGSEDVLIRLMEERVQTNDESHIYVMMVVEDLAEAWRQSKLAKEMERIVPKTTDAESEDDAKSVRVMSKPRSMSLTRYRMMSLDSSIPMSHPNGDMTHMEESIPTEAKPLMIDAWLASMPQGSNHLPADSLALIDSYFVNTHSWFPIIEKHHVYRTYHQYSKGQDITHEEQGQLSCLLAILANAEMRRASQCKMLDNATFSTALAMLERAIESVPLGGQSLELTHIQALLISSLVHVDMGRCADAWVLVGRATQALFADNPDSNGLASRCKDQERLNHAIRGCYMLDTILASRLRLTPHLWHQAPPDMAKVDEDGMEEWASADGVFLTSGTHPGPMLTLSTFNEMADAAHEHAEAIAVMDSPETDQVAHIDCSPHEVTNYLTPQRLTLELLKVATVALRHQRSNEAELDGASYRRLYADTRKLCKMCARNIQYYRPGAVPSILGPIIASIFESIDQLESADSTPPLQAIEAMLSATQQSPAMLTLKVRVSKSIAIRQSKEVAFSIMPPTPVTLQNVDPVEKQSVPVAPMTFENPASRVTSRKRMPPVHGLGIQDIDFGLFPELEEEAEVSDKPLDRIMAQLRDTTVVPTASTPDSPNARLRVLPRDVSGNFPSDFDSFIWDNDCEDSLQNLGYPILDDAGATIHPLLNLPSLSQ